MRLRTGDMFAEPRGTNVVLLCSTNASVTSDGWLVMGRGAARQMAAFRRGIQAAFGARVRQLGAANAGSRIVPRATVPPYGLILIDDIGAFQVKDCWWDHASLDLIRFSCGRLAEEAARRQEAEFWLNFPGIGCGDLRRDAVLPVISESLPDNVVVWELP